MKKDERTGQSDNHITSPLSITRREFLKRMGVLGSGIIVYICVGDRSSIAQETTDFNAFLRIGVDGKVTCFTGKIEMGQGIITSLAQMIADELDVAFDAIDMVMGDTDLCPWDRGTWGSMSTRQFGPILREAAAEARAVLIELTAEYLKTPPKRLRAKDGVIFDQTRTTNRV
ncbi:MAG: molybdopterin-dependent oxidoreductase, partial [Deltaproteobacteria bacterium]